MSNPVAAATLPKPNVEAEITSAAEEEEDGKVQSLSAEQEARFLAVADQDRLHALWRLLLDAGLRPGEAFALQWRHVDFDRGEVRVRGTLARVRGKERKERGRGWRITAPKTKHSRREVPVSDITLQHLRQWKKEQIAERLQLGPEWQARACPAKCGCGRDHNFVFTTPLGTPLGNNVGRVWGRLLATADGKQGDLGTWGAAPPPKPEGRPGPQREAPFAARFSIYVLRHTCATLLLEAGEDLLTVSRRLGHSDMAFTARTYGHLKAKHTKSAAAAVARRWASGIM